VSTALVASTDELICDQQCVDGLFAAAGIQDGTISLNAGSEKVVLTKGQRPTVVKIGKDAKRISAIVASSDGNTVVKLGSDISEISSNVQSSFASKTSASDGGNGFNLMYLLLIIPILGALAVINRRKQSANNQ
jgi:hypothetical protein